MGIRQCTLEGVVTVELFDGAYRGRKVLVTGHTGFKGSWLVLWLKALGANVSGIALDPPDSHSHWQQLNLDIEDYRQDICDAEAVAQIIAKTKPEIVFHLAAQPLVRRSYHEPLRTWATNVQGTVHVLEACRQNACVQAVIVVTSDKCYENLGQGRAYREADRLGGHDPYSASKAAVELVASSYRDSFFNQPGLLLLATARAGNVIGGGDWSEDRLIPDLVQAKMSGRVLEIRSPFATRPWQHVLDPLAGYLLLGQRLLSGDRSAASAWNFGPEKEGDSQVLEILQMMKQEWRSLAWHINHEDHVHEAALLNIDSSKAKECLGWLPVWDLKKSVHMCAKWYSRYLNEQGVDSVQQLEIFIQDAQQRRCNWTGLN